VHHLLAAGLALLLATAAQATELHLSESAAREVENDRFVATLAGRTTAEDAAAAQDALDRLMRRALETLAERAALTVETGAYAVRPERPDDGPEHWVARQTLALESSERAALVAAVDALQALGLAVERLGARLSDARAEEVRDALVRAAARRLRARAAVAADAFGLEVAGWRRLELDGARPAPRAAMMQADAGAAPPALVRGRTTVRVTLAATAALAAPQPR
jgi:predicted secreted protein